jgi:hypothetical protein
MATASVAIAPRLNLVSNQHCDRVTCWGSAKLQEASVQWRVGIGLTTFTTTVNGVSLTIDNPNGNVLFGDDTFGFILGGLFIDGGFAPNLDWTFSEDVQLVDYTLGNQDDVDLFDLTQGGLSSLGQVTDPVGTFPFTNTTDTFLGGQAISLVTSNHENIFYTITHGINLNIII